MDVSSDSGLHDPVKFRVNFIEIGNGYEHLFSLLDPRVQMCLLQAFVEGPLGALVEPISECDDEFHVIGCHTPGLKIRHQQIDILRNLST